ncbi:MAG: RNA polymerase sigma factor [Planctomycetia bacterium]|jgi:RNA polymerase sigma-70 factor (ECF subfamily)
MEALRGKLAAGQGEAFAELYDALAERLYRFLVVRLGSRTDADDVLQEVFVRLARSREQFTRVENLTAYVFTVARNEAVRFGKRRSRRRSVEVTLNAETLGIGGAGEAERQEQADLIASGLARLNAAQREIVELKAFAGLTFAEIATVTKTPQGTVATRYRKGIEVLRTFFERQES